MNDTENEVDHEHEEILPPPPPPSSKSNIWKFFSKEKKNNKIIAKCNTCRNVIYSVNGDATSNLWAHVKKVHKSLIGIPTNQYTIEQCSNTTNGVSKSYINILFLKQINILYI